MNKRHHLRPHPSIIQETTISVQRNDTISLTKESRESLICESFQVYESAQTDNRTAKSCAVLENKMQHPHMLEQQLSEQIQESQLGTSGSQFEENISCAKDCKASQRQKGQQNTMIRIDQQTFEPRHPIVQVQDLTVYSSMPKTLYYSDQTKKQACGSTLLGASQCDNFADKYSAAAAQTQFFDPSAGQYSRKEKSLGELCRRFLGLYGSQGRSLLYLDQCTRELAVERRRIYDIINILESFQVINRQAKNAYQWKGIHKIVKSIERQIAHFSGEEEEKLQIQVNQGATLLNQSDRILNFESQLPPFMEISLKKTKSNDQKHSKIPPTTSKLNHQSLLIWQLDEEDDEKNRRYSKYKRDKSLGILCQQFIGLFVTWRKIISLEEAAKQISQREEGIFEPAPAENASDQELDPEEAQKLKTKIRRLYDIANVLQSIGLIEKTNQTFNKKPAFKWVGIHGVHAFVRELGEERMLNGLEHLVNRHNSDSPPSLKIHKTEKEALTLIPSTLQLGLKRTYSESQATPVFEPKFENVTPISDKRPSILSDISKVSTNSTMKEFDMLGQKGQVQGWKQADSRISMKDEDKENIQKNSQNRREIKQSIKDFNQASNQHSMMMPISIDKRFPLQAQFFAPPVPTGICKPIAQKKDSIDILFAALDMMISRAPVNSTINQTMLNLQAREQFGPIGGFRRI